MPSRTIVATLSSFKYKVSCYLFNSENKSLFDRSSTADRKEYLPPLPESPPLSPRKQTRPIKTVDSYDSQEGRNVQELTALIKKLLRNSYQAFEEVPRCFDETLLAVFRPV